MSFNIRVATTADGPDEWKYRRDAVGSMIRAQNVDLIGFQEVTKRQREDLIERLPDYSWVGIGRMGGEESEFSPVFYRSACFEMLDHGTFWLNEQPDQPIKGWDAAYVRIMTWAKLRERESGNVFVMANTHLDNKGEQARQNGAKLIMQQLATIAGVLPTIITGDYNCGPESIAYCAMTQGAGALNDTRLCSREGHTGAVETFPGFRQRPAPRPCLIDYIFTSPSISVVRTATLPDDWEERQLSDHRAIYADVEIR